MKNYRFLDSDKTYLYIFIIINIFVIFFLLLSQSSVISGKNLYGIIDQHFPELNTNYNIWRDFFTWDSSRGIGTTQYVFIPSVFEGLWVLIPSLIFSNPFLLNFIRIFTLQFAYYFGFFLILFTIYRFILYKQTNFKALSVISLFSCMGLLNFYFFQTSNIFMFNQRFNLLIFGLLFYYINKIYYSDKGVVMFIISSILSFGCWAFFWFWLPFFLLLFFYLVFLGISHGKWGKICKIFGLHILLILSFFILLLFFYFETIVGGSLASKYKDLYFESSNKNSILPNVFGEIGGVNWDLNWGWNSNAVYPYHILFKGNILFMISAYVLFILFLLSIIHLGVRKREQFSQNFLIFATVGVLLSISIIKSYNAPFGKIFTFLLNNFSPFIIFRESQNKFYPILLILILSCIFVYFYLASIRTKKIIIFLLLFSAILFLFILFRYNIYSSDGAFKFPYNEYSILKEIIPSESRVFFLPEYSFNKRYEWGYTGNSINRFMFDFQQFDIAFLQDKTLSNPEVENLLDNFNFLNYPKIIYNFGSLNPSFDKSLLDKFNIEYVVFEKTRDGDMTKVSINKEEYISNLKAIKGLDNIYENDYFLVLKNPNILPEIYSKWSSFQNINPTKYNLYISNLSTSQSITFLESYHKDWKLYLIKNPTNSWCNSLEYYSNSQTIECKSDKKFLEGEELSYLWKKPMFDSSHTTVYGYANSWTIDPDYIKSNYSSEYYTENLDGSINVEFVMYFKPQSYFYLGLLISGTTLVCCIGYLIYDYRKKRKEIKPSFKNLKHDQK